MKQVYRAQYKVWCLLMVTCFCFNAAYAQPIPADQNYSFFGTNSANGLSTRLVQFGGINYTVATIGTLTSGTHYSFFGNGGTTTATGGPFRDLNPAYIFNYSTTGGGSSTAYAPFAGQTPAAGCDYRMSFSQTSPADTTQKSGNFGMVSMYLAIGAGNTSNVIIQGFRAGKMMVECTISNLTAGRSITVGEGSSSNIALTGSNVDAYAGVNLAFGTNWQFLDGLRFILPSGNTPLEIDDFDFTDPTDFPPSTQSSSIGFTNTTGVSSQINWTSGSGDSVAVFVAATGSSATLPATHTFYKSSTTFGSGDQIASTGWYCIYRGIDGVASPSTSVYGLTPGTVYKAMAISYNGAFGWENYHTTATSNINNFTTIAIPSTQASNISVTPDYTDFRKATISWTNGSGVNGGVKRAVFVRNNTSSSDPAVAPLNNNNNADAQHYTYTAFTDSASISPSSSARVGSSGWYCVYNNTGTSVAMTRITVQPGQTLRVMVVAYNGTAGSETYNTTSASSNVIDYFNANYPLAITDPATSVTSSGATLNGSIDPRQGNITNGSFTYSVNSSLSPVLGTITTLSPVVTSITGSASATAVAGALTGLSPSTTYYYRLSATNNAGALAASNNTGGASNGIRSFVSAPAVSSVNATTASGSYKTGQLIVVTVVFTSAVTVTGTPAITLNSGGTAAYASGSGTATLSFNYTVTAGQNSADLDYTSTSALALSGGTINDASNNNALLTLPTVGGASSLGGQKNIVIDTQVPTLGTVTIVSNNANTALAKAGDVVTLAFTASETINAPTVTIASHSITPTNTSANNWTAAYTMAAGDASGTVAFNIAFSDIAANAGTAVTATTNSSSISFDKTAPSLTPVTIVSNNANVSLAKTGDLVTLNFTSGETIATPAVTIAGHTAVVTNTSGNNWTAAFTMVIGDASGTVTFNISFSDLAGNAGVSVTATTNSSNVVFDKTAPGLTPVTIASNNANTALAKVGDLVTLSFTAGEAIVTPTVTIAGHSAVITNTSGNNWIAAYTMAGADATGTIPFNIAFSDLAGNTGTAVTATTNSSNISFDKTAPTLTSSSIASNNANTALAKAGNAVTVSFVSDEPIASPTVTIAGSAATVANTSGNNWTAVYTMANSDITGTVSFSIAFSDLAGNAGTTVTTTTNSSSVSFDKTVPTLTAVTVGSNNTNPVLAKVGDIITLNFTSSETVAVTVVTIAGHTAAVTNTSGNNWTAASAMISSDAAGVVQFTIAFSDLAGNTGTAVTATTNSSTVSFDKTAPSLTAAAIVSNNANTGLAKTGDIITLAFTSNETISLPAVTIAGHAAAVTNGGGNNWSAVYTMVSADAPGTIPFNITFSDPAGNAGNAVSATTNSSSVVFDKTAPSLSTVTIASDNANGSRAKAGDKVTLSFTSNETIATPAVALAGKTASVTNISGNNWAAVYTLLNSDAEGVIALNISFSDIAGNTGTPVTATTNSSTVLFDKTQPSVSSINRLTASPTNLATVDYAVTFSEAVTGVDIADFALTNAAVTGASVASVSGSNDVYTVTVNTGSGDGTIRLDLNSSGTGITDLSGNPVSGGFVSGQVYVISKIGLPVITAHPANSSICSGNNTSFPVTASSSDAITYQWQVNNGNGFTNLGNTAPYSNVTTPVLTITNATTALNNYQYRCVATNSTGSVNSNAAVLTVNALPTVGAITGINNTCVNSTAALTSTTSGGVWSSSNAAVATISTGGIVSGAAAGTITVTYTVTSTSGCITAVTAPFTVNPLPTVTVQPAAGFISRGSSIRLTAVGSAGTTIAWTPAVSLDNATSFTPTARPLENTNYIATVSTAAGCKATTAITVLSTEDPAVLSPAILFTPNGDGINDKFVITNIDAYPVNTFQVFNKTGKIIFQATNYHNEWDGTSASGPLTTGTYYYVLRVRDTIVKKGAINVLVR